MADGPGAALFSLTPDHCIGLYPALVVGWRPGTGPKTKPAPTGAGQRGRPWCPEQRVDTQWGGSEPVGHPVEAVFLLTRCRPSCSWGWSSSRLCWVPWEAATEKAGSGGGSRMGPQARRGAWLAWRGREPGPAPPPQAVEPHPWYGLWGPRPAQGWLSPGGALSGGPRGCPSPRHILCTQGPGWPGWVDSPAQHVLP